MHGDVSTAVYSSSKRAVFFTSLLRPNCDLQIFDRNNACKAVTCRSSLTFFCMTVFLRQLFMPCFCFIVCFSRYLYFELCLFLSLLSPHCFPLSIKLQLSILIIPSFILLFAYMLAKLPDTHLKSFHWSVRRRGRSLWRMFINMSSCPSSCLSYLAFILPPSLPPCPCYPPMFLIRAYLSKVHSLVLTARSCMSHGAQRRNRPPFRSFIFPVLSAVQPADSREKEGHQIRKQT